MHQIAEGLWQGLGRRPDDLAVWSIFTSQTAIVAAVGLTPTRAHLGLPVMLANGKSQGRIGDVSRNPGLWVETIRSAAEKNGQHADRWSKAVRQSVNEMATLHGWATPGDGFPLRTLVTTACWPGLLGAATAGADLPSELPRWSRELLSGPTVTDGFLRVLGPRAASDVTTAGQACLAGDVAWWPLAAMLAASHSPGHIIAKILAHSGPGPMPDDAEFTTLRQHFAATESEIVLELLLDTALELNGPSRLLAALEHLPADSRLERRLVEVEVAGLRPR